MMLLVDVGNTRVKWATCEAGCLGPQRAEPHAGWSLQDVQQHIVALTAVPERVIVSNVGGPAMATLLIDAAAQAWGIQPVFVQAGRAAAGVRNAYAEPEKLGVDRWLALIAAHAMVTAAACVVSVGTAMTIDGIAADGRHLGGLITPGPQLMVQSLLGGTSDIAARAGALQVTNAVLAADTTTGIHNGARHALAALIVRVADWVRMQVGQPPAIILTGGASALVADLLPWSCQSVPDLVLRGLAIIANEA
jgi:type III pantothenate kinase